MDGYQFTASVIGSLAWPVSGVTMALVLRKPIVALIGRARKAEGFGAKLEFADEVKSIQDAVESSSNNPPSPTAIQLNDDRDSSKLEDSETSLSKELASTSATGSIIASWSELEQSLRAVAEKDGLTPHNNIAAVISSLVGSGRLSNEALKSLSRLRKLRNDVAHGVIGPNLTLEDAAAFRDTSKLIKRRLDKWLGTTS